MKVSLTEAAGDVLEDALRRAGPGSPETTTISFFWLNRLKAVLEENGVKFDRDGTRYELVVVGSLEEKYKRIREQER